MKTLIILAFTFSALAFGNTPLTLKDFSAMDVDQRAKVIEAYKEFLREYSKTTSHGEFASRQFSFISEAIANGNFDCFYAGWPSQSVRSGGKRLCTSPLRGNPDYARLSSGCGQNTLLCQPAIFGSGICVSTATQKLRNSAFAQCEIKFREAGRTTADVIRELTPPEQRADLDELIRVGQDICTRGLQAGTNMCSRLVNKLIAIKNGLPAQPQTADASRPGPASRAQTDATPRTVTRTPPDATPQPDSGTQPDARALEAAARAAVTVTTTDVSPRPVDCDPNTPGIQTEPPARSAQVQTRTQLQRAEPLGSDRFRVPTCNRGAPTARTRPEMDAFLAENNIHIVSGTVTDERHLQRFIDDYMKFPAGIREEMKRKNSRINLIVGNGVSEDPSWAAEARSSRSPGAFEETHDGRDWSNVQGSGGSLGRPSTPTRLVINKSYDNRLPSVFLHEYAHTMDSMYGRFSISKSQIWSRTLASEPRASEYLSAMCANNYCNDPAHPEEAFAELFANYHACPETRSSLQTYMPNIFRFFERMTNVRALLDGRIDMSSRSPAASPR